MSDDPKLQVFVPEFEEEAILYIYHRKPCRVAGGFEKVSREDLFAVMSLLIREGGRVHGLEQVCKDVRTLLSDIRSMSGSCLGEQE